MNKFIVLGLLLFITSMGYSQANGIVGTWVLSNVQSDAIITVNANRENSISISTDKPEPTAEKKTMPLAEYLKKDMRIGVTNFVFNSNGTFEFSRTDKTTFSGSYAFSGNGLVLHYTDKGYENEKQNKIVTLTGQDMVMESESMGKKVLFSFVKSK